MAKSKNDYQMKNLIDGSNLSLIKSFSGFDLSRTFNNEEDKKEYFTTIQNFNKDRFDLDIQPLANATGNSKRKCVR